MSQWVRPLHQLTPAAAQWHAPLTRSFATTTHCGKVLEGSIEVTNDNDKAERQGRCGACLTRVAASERIAVNTLPRARTAPATKPAAKKPVAKKPVAKKPVAKKPVAKKPAAKKTAAKKPAPKRRSGAKRVVRRSGRGRA